MAKKGGQFLLPVFPPGFLESLCVRKLPPMALVILHGPAKSRTIMVRLISMAMTGYYRTMQRPRAHQPLSMLKYDPVVRKQVLFLEAKRGKNK
ncbi:hypothetical protein IAQ61_001465 [Plenodomus lingam]|uniref:uncharacterized protein n=1 Tax=Leptosphaeria maculans TaxID=5022 RepID=UPI0033326F54|nr:hypothetical protein IAQ61_001465 [Plenodomus lingam]